MAKTIAWKSRGCGPVWCEVEWLFEPRDLWVGIFWKTYPHAIEFYIGPLPTLPIRLYFQFLR